MTDGSPLPRAYWSQSSRPQRYQSGFNEDWGLEAVSGEQGITLAVTEEKAMDSYNQDFTCQTILSREEAESLFQWLAEVLGK